MKILAIESSCDETAAAVLDTRPNFPHVPNDFDLQSNVVVSQIDIFKAYGGVIPEVAARSHLEAILPVVDKALADAGATWPDIDAIAVTHTPGLLGSLLIGTLTARTLALLHDKPLFPVHHLKSHLYSALLDSVDNSSEDASAKLSLAEGPELRRGVAPGPRNDGRPGRASASETFHGSIRSLQFPALTLIVSGGHTQIIHMTSHDDFEIVATTRDDAVGECFDKVAKILGLPYPGGPAISKAAQTGNRHKYRFPHPKLTDENDEKSLDFSFSGLKTAVLRSVQKELGLPISHPSHDLKNHLTTQQIADFAASFEQTAVDILLENLLRATETYPCATIVIAGGVSANELLRQQAVVAIDALSGEQANNPISDSAQVTTEQISATPVTTGGRDCCPKRIRLLTPSIEFSGDNAAMVALAAAYEIASGATPTDPYSLNISPRSPIH